MLKVNRTARVSDAAGFRRMFAPGRLTLGVFFPIEAFAGDEPTMRRQERLARRAEELGFAALWVRDVPLRDPNFGDIGQVYDPWVYLGWIAAKTRTIALATGSIILPCATRCTPPRRPPRSTNFRAVGSCSASRPATGRSSSRRSASTRQARCPFPREPPRHPQRCSPRSSRRSDRAMARCSGRPTSCQSRPVGCRSWSPAAAGKAWNGSPSIRTAGSPTRGPSSGRQSSPHAGVPPWLPRRRVCSNRSPSRSMSI